MNWTDMLQKEIEDSYKSADGLMAKVDALEWTPQGGKNWMSTSQLLMHMTIACGFCCRGLVTGDWGPIAEMSDEDMLPPADRMPTVKSVEQARELLAADKQVALAMIAEAGEERLAGEQTTAPWDPSETLLGHRLLQMVGHLNTHKTQLFYYLKLQGKPVHTGDMYGLPA